MSEPEINIDDFKRLLLQKQAELRAIAEVSDDAAGVVELDQTRVGRVSRMDALRAQAMSKEAKQRRELELKKIAAALARIETDDYGYCLSCGEMISAKRLQNDPANPLCINCAK